MKKSLDYNLFRKFASDNGIDFVAVYGSYFNGNFNEKSDIDLIIDSKNDLNSDILKQYSQKLKKLINMNVDLISPKLMISSLICGHVWRLKEYELIYGSPVVSIFNERKIG